jgi:hypothetical protein
MVYVISWRRSIRLHQLVSLAHLGISVGRSRTFHVTEIRYFRQFSVEISLGFTLVQ